jgi:predicted RNA-binding Zn-ribbon protein involved in translation (DUF1610 family)
MSDLPNSTIDVQSGDVLEVQVDRRMGYNWVQFGCPKCGNVVLLPAMRDEETPWCLHAGGNYSWHEPHRLTQTEDGGVRAWTKMVRVKVTVA